MTRPACVLYGPRRRCSKISAPPGSLCRYCLAWLAQAEEGECPSRPPAAPGRGASARDRGRYPRVLLSCPGRVGAREKGRR